MKPSIIMIHVLNFILGLPSVAALIYSMVILIIAQPIMTGFLPLSGLQETLLSGVGVGQLMALIYFIFSLVQVVRFVKFAEEVKALWVALIISTVIGLLGVFVNIPLLSDIHKQYQARLSQPEWLFLFPSLGFQLIVAVAYFVLHLSHGLERKAVDFVARDIHLFLILQIVGLICGLTGLVYTSLGFVFANGWTLLVHTVMGSRAILVPYLIAILLWVATNLHEGERHWWDEKQGIDLGKSALMTLTASTILMLLLFVVNYQDLAGVIRYLWMPFYLFSVMTFFSAGNLYFSSQA